jgi:hypothetical protein
MVTMVCVPRNAESVAGLQLWQALGMGNGQP